MQLPRASGILLHPTSLPGRYGIGDLGPEAHAFVDFLAETGQTWWQIAAAGAGRLRRVALPVALVVRRQPAADQPRPPGRPGLARRPGARRGPGPARRTGSTSTRWPSSSGNGSAGRSGASPRRGTIRPSRRSAEQHRSWLDDYVFFQALRDAHDGQPWYEWEPELVAREPDGLRPMARAARRGHPLPRVRPVRLRDPVAGAAGRLQGRRGSS